MLAMPYAEQSLKLHYWSDMEPVPTFFMAMPNGQYLVPSTSAGSILLHSNVC